MRKTIMFKKLFLLYIYFYFSRKSEDFVDLLRWLEAQIVLLPVGKRHWDIEDTLEDKIKEIRLKSIDGVDLYGWYVPAQPNMPTVLYCHGQGENVTKWQNIIKFLSERGFGVMMPEYRGHYKSSGTPSEIGLYRDASAALYYLENQENIQRKDVIAWGRSLGGAVAIDVASRNDFLGVILESTFSNIKDLVFYTSKKAFEEGNVSFLKDRLLRKLQDIEFVDRFENDEKIKQITSATLIVHSIDDEKIPCSMSERLAAMKPDAEFFLSEKGNHEYSEWAFDRIGEFLDNLLQTRKEQETLSDESIDSDNEENIQEDADADTEDACENSKEAAPEKKKKDPKQFLSYEEYELSYDYCKELEDEEDDFDYEDALLKTEKRLERLLKDFDDEE